jgi:hypothetical protein
MYFFDLEDLCIDRVVGTNSLSIFNRQTVCTRIKDTFIATMDALRLGINRWYDVSNPYVSVYQFGGGTKFWPASPSGYDLYNGGWTWNNSTVGDDGYTTTPIKLPAKFKVNGLESIDLYVSTNGYFTLNEGRFVYPTSPDVGPPATMAGNPGDNFLKQGDPLSDTTTQNLYYRTGSDGGGRFYVSILVYGGELNSPTTPTSWLATFYKDINYQWFEVQVKPTSSIRGLAGPYNATSVAVAPSTVTKVWRGDLNGQNWTYMGEGVVNATAPASPTPRVCPQCDTYLSQYMALTGVGGPIRNFWLDADNSFSNTTQANFTTYVQNMYHERCLLKQLLKCVDGDLFETFDNDTNSFI